MSNLFLRRWRHENASNENIGESTYNWFPQSQVHLPQKLAVCVPQASVVLPAAMQVDRSRLCATSQHALICRFMPLLLQVFAFLYLVGVATVQVAYSNR